MDNHSPTFLRAAVKTQRSVPIAKPDGYAIQSNDCGDLVEISVVTDGKVVASIGARVQGCLGTNACTNALVQLVEGKKLPEAWALTPEHIATYLKTLPNEHFHCAELVIGTLRQALTKCCENQRANWKKVYQRHPAR